ncbi:FdhF/YdeP family oxidoreductase [Puia dinghuensis]|uniref:Formate dehydrogenase subunit alpha n=1 Tax=Puia dinghuensis TaxID=1792502 RepID=A0A8J2XW58_9BACT|nr:FdhF/YdeP family oxidoreductase [Puia dinghuensis]GGB16985.1 formate dehydrogenase subunit alpha [Puia dinghuensis]
MSKTKHPDIDIKPDGHPNGHPSAENPDDLTGLHTGSIRHKAVGLPAIVSSFRHAIGEAGLTRGLKALAHVNQKGGYDCPSCAWPDPDDERSGFAEYCENGAKAIAEEATTKKLIPEFFQKHSVTELASLTDYHLGSQGRIAQPMYLPKDATHYQPISWDEAFSLIARHLNALSSPDEAVFYTSGRTSNEAAFLYQLFAREYGTNNLPDCSNMCHESSGVALGESLGLGKGSVTLDDLYQAEVIIIMGQNPGTNAPRMLTALQKAKHNGATIISVNPLPETGLMAFNNPQQVKGILGLATPLTDLYLPIKLNGDMALLQAIELLLWLEEEKAPGTVFDMDFIHQRTTGYEAFLQHLQQVSLPDLSEACGIPIADIGKAANIIKDKKKIIFCWAMGLTQHTNAVDSIKEIANLLLLKGSIGKPGAGTCPVRGHSNVQGDRTMGIWEKPTPKFLDSIEKVFGFQPPRKHGYDVVSAIRAMYEGRASVFFAMGGNFLSATPDTEYTAEALRRCRLTVQVSTKLNRSHLVHGEEALILPCLARSDRDFTGDREQFVSCENSMGVVQSSKGVLQPVSSHLLSEPAIVCHLAKATLKARPGATKVNWDAYLQDYDFIRDAIESTIPGFDHYNKRVREPGGFYLPNAPREGKFNTPDGKAQFNIASPATIALEPGQLMMMTIRSHDQFNTTIYGLDDRYRGVFNERRVIFLNQEDMHQQGLQPRDIVDIYNDYGGTRRIAHRFVVIPYPIPRQCAATYYPETNVLVPIDSVAQKSNTPVSKLILIRLQKSSTPLP